MSAEQKYGFTVDEGEIEATIAERNLGYNPERPMWVKIGMNHLCVVLMLIVFSFTPGLLNQLLQGRGVFLKTTTAVTERPCQGPQGRNAPTESRRDGQGKR